MSSKKTSRTSTRNVSNRKVVFCYTGIAVEKGLKRNLSKINASYVDNYNKDVTHVVMQKKHVKGRTMKIMLALAGTCTDDGLPHFVNEDFVNESIRSDQLQNESDFKPIWTKDEEKKHGVNWQKTLQQFKNRKGPLFNGYRIFMSKAITKNSRPSKSDVTALIKFGGGTILGRLPRSGSVDSGGDLVILALDEKDAKKYEANKPSGGIFDVKVLFDAVFLQQPFNIMNKNHLRLDGGGGGSSSNSSTRSSKRTSKNAADGGTASSTRKRRRR